MPSSLPSQTLLATIIPPKASPLEKEDVAISNLFMGNFSFQNTADKKFLRRNPTHFFCQSFHLLLPEYHGEKMLPLLPSQKFFHFRQSHPQTLCRRSSAAPFVLTLLFCPESATLLGLKILRCQFCLHSCCRVALRLARLVVCRAVPLPKHCLSRRCFRKTKSLFSSCGELIGNFGCKTRLGPARSAHDRIERKMLIRFGRTARVGHRP